MVDTAITKEKIPRFKTILFSRFRVVRQPGERARGHPGHERVPGGDEATQGSAEEVPRLRKAILNPNQVEIHASPFN